jgi:integrase/recombinase XerD
MSERRARDRLRVNGPLAEFADGYRVDLIERGYSLGSAQTHLRLLADVSLWMQRERKCQWPRTLEPASLTAGVLERYCVSRRQAGHSTYLSPRSPGRLLGYLDGLGVLPVEETVLSPVDRLLEEFRRYLLVERGMAECTVELYARPARVFLAERSEPFEDDLTRLSGAEVIAFVLRESRWALQVVGGGDGVRVAGAAAVLARAGVDLRAACGGGAVGRSPSGAASAYAGGRGR